MTDAFSDLVIPIFREAIELKDKLSWQRDPPGLEDVKQLALGWLVAADRKAQADPTLASEFALAKYGLVAWVDELLADSKWGEQHGWARPSGAGDLGDPASAESNWGRSGGGPAEEQALEWELYKENHRAWKFYKYAERAYDAASRARTSTDPLETYLLCVALGFQGECTEEGGLQAWVDRVYAKVTEASPLEQKPFPDDAPGPTPEGLRPRRGPGLLLRASILFAITTLITLAGYLYAIHASLNDPNSY